MGNSMFEDIRPYYEEEIPAAMQRIVSDPYFPLVCNFVFPGRPITEVAAVLGSCRTAEPAALSCHRNR